MSRGDFLAAKDVYISSLPLPWCFLASPMPDDSFSPSLLRVEKRHYFIFTPREGFTINFSNTEYLNVFLSARSVPDSAWFSPLFAILASSYRVHDSWFSVLAQSKSPVLMHDHIELTVSYSRILSALHVSLKWCGRPPSSISSSGVASAKPSLELCGRRPSAAIVRG